VALRFPRFKTLLTAILVVLLATMLVLAILVETTRLPGDRAVVGGMVRDSAFYLTTRDGTRIAVDRWLPEGLEVGARIPTLVRSTRYWRSSETGPLMRLRIRLGIDAESSVLDSEMTYFNDQGYAVLLVDARGTGASFGSREVEWGQDELDDLTEVVDWIVGRDWSNGRVGGWGVSYEGNTAAMLAATGHPAVRAVAPRFVDHHAWRDLVWPGGVFDVGMIGDWGTLVGALDRNDICSLAGVTGAMCYFVQAMVPGVKPVDGPDGRRLLAEAVESHRTPDISAAARQAEFLDDPFGASGVTMGDVSIAGRQSRMEAGGAAVFVWASWTDAGTQAGALRLASSWQGPGPLDLVLGPWSHGAGHDTDPFREPAARPIPSGPEQMEMLAGFFDGHLRDDSDAPAGALSGVRIRYRPLGMPSGEAGWWQTRVWPPAGTSTRTLFATESGLMDSPAPQVTVTEYAVDFSHSAGPSNRWQTQLGGSDVRYPDRASADSLLLVWDSEPLTDDLVLTGSPVLHLPLAVDREDGAVHAYLEAVGPGGEVRYITEGLIRLLHRGDGLTSPTFRRADASSVEPGRPMAVRVEFQPTAAIVPAGHRIRLAVGGADSGMFTRYPESGELNWRVEVGGPEGLRLDLPVGHRPIR